MAVPVKIQNKFNALRLTGTNKKNYKLMAHSSQMIFTGMGIFVVCSTKIKLTNKVGKRVLFT